MIRTFACALAVAGALALPAQAHAGGGIDPAKDCVDAAYMRWNPQQMPSTVAFAGQIVTCANHLKVFASPPRAYWLARCLQSAIRPDSYVEQLMADIPYCVETYLGFDIQIDPTPQSRRKVSAGARGAGKRAARARSRARRGR